MEAVVEGLLYVQGDLGVTINQVCEILEIDEDRAKEIILNLKNYYDENNRGLRINFLGNTIKLTTREVERNKFHNSKDVDRNTFTY